MAGPERRIAVFDMPPAIALAAADLSASLFP
jgi:hypothetical protein